MKGLDSAAPTAAITFQGKATRVFSKINQVWALKKVTKKSCTRKLLPFELNDKLHLDSTKAAYTGGNEQYTSSPSPSPIP